VAVDPRYFRRLRWENATTAAPAFCETGNGDTNAIINGRSRQERSVADGRDPAGRRQEAGRAREQADESKLRIRSTKILLLHLVVLERRKELEPARDDASSVWHWPPSRV
jgi:hypothetical protein